MEEDLNAAKDLHGVLIALKLRLFYTIYKYLICTSKRTQCPNITETNQLELYRWSCSMVLKAVVFQKQIA